MRRILPLVLAVTAISVAAPRAAHAGFGLRNSIGDSLYIVQPPKSTPNGGTCQYFCYAGDLRRPADLEIMPYYSFGFLTLDLAVIAQLEAQTGVGFSIGIRPGVRVFPFLGLFIRASLPLVSSNLGFNNAYFQYNLSLGVGYQVRLGPWGFFAELDFNPALEKPFNLPVELRLGIALEQ